MQNVEQNTPAIYFKIIIIIVINFTLFLTSVYLGLNINIHKLMLFIVNTNKAGKLYNNNKHNNHPLG